MIIIIKMGMLGLLFNVTLRKIIDKTIPWRGKG
jgi:taurine transport system permease protein